MESAATGKIWSIFRQDRGRVWGPGAQTPQHELSVAVNLTFGHNLPTKSSMPEYWEVPGFQEQIFKYFTRFFEKYGQFGGWLQPTPENIEILTPACQVRMTS